MSHTFQTLLVTFAAFIFFTLLFTHITFATCHKLSHVVYLVSNSAYLVSSLSYIPISQSGIWQTLRIHPCYVSSPTSNCSFWHKFERFLTKFNDICFQIYNNSCFWKYVKFYWSFLMSHVGAFSKNLQQMQEDFRVKAAPGLLCVCLHQPSSLSPHPPHPSLHPPLSGLTKIPTIRKPSEES